MTAAADIPLAAFRQIFIWPLAAAPTEDLRKKIGDLADGIDTPWEPVPDPLRYLETNDDELSREAYQEFVYFHGFVQKLLFNNKSKALRIFKRNDIRKLEVCLMQDRKAIRLKIDRLHLYLFDIGVSMLVVETSSESLTLADALTLGDHTRRVYPPFWEKNGEPGLYPQRLTWYDEYGNPIGDNVPEGQPDFIEHVSKERCSPMASHWRRLFPEHFGFHGYAKDGLHWRHVVDERIPTMTFVATNRVDDITRGDWVRLCFVDEASFDVSLPYSEAFLRDFESEHTYDRFWGNGSHKSRILISGYGFSLVSDTSEFSLNVMQTNFRRHYFQMGLMLHFQMAALLTISAGLSQAVSDYGSNSKDFKDRIRELRESLLHFTHGYWFTGLSNHVQAREIYELWRSRLGLKTLYDEIDLEAREVDEYQRAKNEEEKMEANERLMTVATFSIPPALAIGFLGINVIIGKDGGWTDLCSWITVAIVVLIFYFVSGVFVWILNKNPFYVLCRWSQKIFRRRSVTASPK